MNETILIKSRIAKGRIFLWTFLTIIFLLFFAIYVDICVDEAARITARDYGYSYKVEKIRANSTGNLVLMWIILSVVQVIIAYYQSNCELIVTTERIYGKKGFGKTIVLPIDTVYNIHLGISTMTISAPIGKIKMKNIKNRYEIVNCIKNLIEQRRSQAMQQSNYTYYNA